MIYIVQSGSPKENYIRIEMATKDMNKAVDVFADLLIRDSELQVKLSIWVESEDLITEIDNTIKETLKQEVSLKDQIRKIVENKAMPYVVEEHNQNIRKSLLRYTEKEMTEAVEECKQMHERKYKETVSRKDNEIKFLKEVYGDYKNTVLKLLENQRMEADYD